MPDTTVRASGCPPISAAEATTHQWLRANAIGPPESSSPALVAIVAKIARKVNIRHLPSAIASDT
jgi:hypothetical protein